MQSYNQYIHYSGNIAQCQMTIVIIAFTLKEKESLELYNRGKTTRECKGAKNVIKRYQDYSKKG
jgi:hypothetical protein